MDYTMNYTLWHPHLQDFDYFVVMDFEATCDRDEIPHPQEIIEFPSVVVSGITGQIEACFQTYVRPTCNGVLTDFCKDLTGIQQFQVEGGVVIAEALRRHDEWLERLGIKYTNFAVVTWSDWDCRVMLESECQFKNISKPSYFNRWINLRVPFHQVYGRMRCNLKEAVEMSGLDWEGRAHSGLDDAKNTAHLLGLLMHRGVKLFITSTLNCCQTQEAMSLFLASQRAVEYTPLCFCGVRSNKVMVRKPGPWQGHLFFGCGNWTASGGAVCSFKAWITTEPVNLSPLQTQHYLRW